MAEILDGAMKVSLVLFMAGSLLQTGLGMNLGAALSGLRNPRFVVHALVFGFVLGPAVAWALTRVIPLSEPYAMGLLLLGLTPTAPFLAQMVARAKGDMSLAPAMLLIAALGTVVLLPLAVPVLAPGLSVSAWTIARPLLLVVFLPLVVGLAVRRLSEPTSLAILPAVKAVTAVATLTMVALCVVIYGQGFVETVGHYAILALAIFFTVVTLASYFGAQGLSQPQRSVLGLGMCTRNAGAALAPLFSAASVDPSAVVMVVLGGVPMQIAAALLAARWLAAQASVQGRSG